MTCLASESAAFWFRPVWGLCACAQCTVCIPHLGEGPQSPETRVRSLCECPAEEPGLCFMLSRVIAFSLNRFPFVPAFPLLPD